MAKLIVALRNYVNAPKNNALPAGITAKIRCYNSRKKINSLFVILKVAKFI